MASPAGGYGGGTGSSAEVHHHHGHMLLHNHAHHVAAAAAAASGVQLFHVPQHSRREKLRFPPDAAAGDSSPTTLVSAQQQHQHQTGAWPPPAFYSYASSSSSYSPHSPTVTQGQLVPNEFATQQQQQFAPIPTQNFSLSLSFASSNPATTPPTPKRQQLAGGPAPAAGPYGPFTGYATVLGRSRFLGPAQKLLEEICDVGGAAAHVDRSLPDEGLLDADPMDGADAELDDADRAASDAGPMSGAEQQWKKTRLISMMEEVCKRYRQYYQQVQAVIASFETVAGFNNAAPFAVMALRVMAKHFRHLKSMILNQLRNTSKMHVKEGMSKDITIFGLGGGGGTVGFPRGGSVNGFGQPHNIWRPQRGLPERSVAVLRAWLFEHFLHPYPTDGDKQMLAKQTGLTRNQVSNWFINARVRLWKPMVEEIHNLEMRQIHKHSPLDKSQQHGIHNQAEHSSRADVIAAEEDERISRSPPSTKEKIWMMQDQLIMARAYLQFASPHGSAHLIRELKMRMKEIERAISHSSGGSRLSGSALQKMKAMELTLSKAHRAYPHCSHMASKLRAMTYNSEELVRAHQTESSFLEQVAVRTLPKGHHCLAMQLTSEYFSLDPKEREFPKRFSMLMGDLHHYAIFSDNVLASAVVINSTIAASKNRKRMVFHIVTDALSFPAMTMWFLTNPPSPATIRIESLDELKWLPADFSSRFKQKGIRDPRYTSALNHLRFYLPEVFPSLSKVLLLDHDVVVQKDLSKLWEIDMKGKINGALETCSSGNSYHRLDNLVNFSDQSIMNKFDAKACIYAFGMNIFDLKEWRNKGLTATYDKWFQAGKRRRLWKAGSLSVGQLVFYNQTVPLDHRWHVLGLGRNGNTRREEIESAAVIHYSGNLKPWLEISVPKYRDYWNRYLNYDNTYLQQCNIHS